jgi:hypothetical protein
MCDGLFMIFEKLSSSNAGVVVVFFIFSFVDYLGAIQRDFRWASSILQSWTRYLAYQVTPSMWSSDRVAFTQSGSAAVWHGTRHSRAI